MRAHVEVPAAAAEIARRLERDLVADLPAESLRELRADDAALRDRRGNASHAGLTTYSGYMRRQSSGTIANCGKKFFGSW